MISDLSSPGPNSQETFRLDHLHSATDGLIYGHERGTQLPPFTSTQPIMTVATQDTTFNGWTNYETWNVSLYIQNEFYLYQLAQGCDTYQDFVDLMTESNQFITPDGVSWTHPTLDTEELDEMIAEL